MDPSAIFPLAIGTYGLGAPRIETVQYVPADGVDRSAHLAALTASYAAGANLIDASFAYGGGGTMRFLGSFLRGLPRESMFVTVKIERTVQKASEIVAQLDRYLMTMGLEFADVILLHTRSATKLPLLETYAVMDALVRAGKARHLGASNLGMEDLERLIDEFAIHTFEGLYNLECKVCEDVGLLDLCAKRGIVYLAYKPLRLNRTAARDYPLLSDMTSRYACTQNQLILSWLVREKGVVPLVKAATPAHVAENHAALDIDIAREDLDRLNSFRSVEFDRLVVDWTDTEPAGLPIYRVGSALP